MRSTLAMLARRPAPHVGGRPLCDVVVLRRGGAGRIRPGLLVGLAVLLGVGYVGYQVARHYWVYFNVQEATQTVALDLATGRGGEEGARQSMRRLLAEWGVAVEDKDLKITLQQNGTATIGFSYYAPVVIPKYTHWLYFQVFFSSARRIR